MLRCCIETVHLIAPPSDITQEGDILRCNWCRSRAVLRDGAWEWDANFEGMQEVKPNE
jgi:hypothetical protein